MRYPRAFFVFDKQTDLPDQEYFKGLANSRRNVYLSGASKPMKSLDDEIDLIRSIHIRFNDYKKNLHDILVLSHPKVFDFLLAYFGDKNLKIYWIDNKDMFERIYIANDALEELGSMDSYLYDASHAYFHAYQGFYYLTKRDPHPFDGIISTIRTMASGELRTVLESELRVLLRQLLSVNVMNRFDL